MCDIQSIPMQVQYSPGKAFNYYQNFQKYRTKYKQLYIATLEGKDVVEKAYICKNIYNSCPKEITYICVRVTRKNKIKREVNKKQVITDINDCHLIRN